MLIVYSEFTVKVTSVLKNSTTAAIAPNSDVICDRPVGGVLFPSGTVAYIGQLGMGSPEVGKTYVLFLSGEGPAQDLRIVTGFESTDGKIYAIDGSRAAPGTGRHRSRFEDYDGTGRASFLDLVRKRIAAVQQ